MILAESAMARLPRNERRRILTLEAKRRKSGEWPAWINLTPRQRAEFRCTIGSAATWLIVPCLPFLIVAGALALLALLVALPALVVSHFAYRNFHKGEREWNETRAVLTS